MTRAWLEIDRIGPWERSKLAPWTRVPLDEPMVFVARDVPNGGYEVRHEVEIVPARRGPDSILLEVHQIGDRWFLRPRADIYRNGVRLRRGERYPLDNGDRIEPLMGTWLRFLDDIVPLPLPRLRQAGRAFLFAPTPEDGADRWHAMLRGRDELFVAERIDTSTSAGEDALLEAFPFVVELVHTPRGPYAVARESGDFARVVACAHARARRSA